MYSLLFLEFIGTTELFVVLLFALIIFGPRKLPELSRSLAQALKQMRAASDDFKHTWEAEAHREKEAAAQLIPPAAALPAVELPAAEPSAVAAPHADLLHRDEAPAGFAAQSPVQTLACEPTVPAAVAGAVFESQPVELRG